MCVTKETNMENKSSKVNKEEWHRACQKRISKEGGKATCCDCNPHEDCGDSPTPDTEVAQCLNCHLKFTEWLSDSKECPECEGKVVFFDCLSPTPDTIEEADPQIKGRYTVEDQRAKKQDTEEQSKCECERCLFIESASGVTDIMRCSPKNETREQKIERGAKDFAERFEPVMKELAEEAKNENEGNWSCKWCGGTNIKPPLFGEPENEDWESEFEKMLCNCGTSDFTNHGNLCGYRYYGQQNVNIKSFIKSLIEKQKAEFIEKIKEKIAEYEYHKDMIHCTCLGALKEYIDDLLTSLTKE